MTKPNILYITVDELRFPTVFPKGISTPAEFLERFMPNLYRQWQRGVKFDRFYGGASDCTPGRGTLVTGLYAYQTYLMCTIQTDQDLEGSGPQQPELQPEFPTYGKLLRKQGYDTPYIGKWHVSNSPDPKTATDEEKATYLQDYGFQGLTFPDPEGINGQGVGEILYLQDEDVAHEWSDAEIASEATLWLSDRDRLGDKKPFCLTVGLVNPHDKQWFWKGTEWLRYEQVFSDGNQPLTGSTLNYTPSLSDPPSLGYDLPPNWQSPAELQVAVKDGQRPGLHQLFANFTDGFVGAINGDPESTEFALIPSPTASGQFDAQAPFSYWTRALDMYTLVMTAVDRRIGQIVDSIPASMRCNTVIVFCSDHGDYASSHGFQGKGMSVYNECFRLPFLVVDPREQVTRDVDVVRHQLASHVDVLRMLLDIACERSEEWMPPGSDNAALYGNRLDLAAILRDPEAPGRPYALFTCDEFIPAVANKDKVPVHVVGLVQDEGKLGLYCNWDLTTSQLLTTDGMQVEYFNYGTKEGRLELANSQRSSDAIAAESLFWDKAISSELQAPLPDSLTRVQRQARKALLDYMKRDNISIVLNSM